MRGPVAARCDRPPRERPPSHRRTASRRGGGRRRGADLVEFDVLRASSRHPGVEPAEDPPSLDAALTYLAGGASRAHRPQDAGASQSLRRASPRPRERALVSSNRRAHCAASSRPGPDTRLRYPCDRYGAAGLPVPGASSPPPRSPSGRRCGSGACRCSGLGAGAACSRCATVPRRSLARRRVHSRGAPCSPGR